MDLQWVDRTAERYFGVGALDWWDRAYLVDWTVAIALEILSNVPDHYPPFEREFSRDDPTIDYPHKKNQISGATNNAVALFLPLFILVAYGVVRMSLVDVHHGTLGLLASSGLSRFITEVLKNRVGRLRPDFLARCKWKKSLKACSGKVDKIMEGRKSFPSGHASGVFAGMTFLFLWLAGQSAAWSFSSPTRQSSLLGSRLLRMIFSLLPLFWATWVAVSRVEDYRHHVQDVLVGAFIGAASATTCYLIYWPNPFSARTFSREQAGQPRLLYRPQNTRPRLDSFELTSHDEDESPV